MKPKLDRREISIGQSKEINISGDVYDLINSGQKTLELRPASKDFSGIQVGSVVVFKVEHYAGQAIKAKVTRVKKYTSLKEVIEHEDTEKLARGNTEEEIKRSYSRFNELVINQIGMLLFEFEKFE